MDMSDEQKIVELEKAYITYACNGGFLSPALKLDIPLYRYRSNMDLIVDEIEKEYVYLASLKTLNDPFDSSCVIPYDEAVKCKSPLGYYWETSDFLHEFSWYEKVKDELKSQWSDLVSLEEFSNIVSEKASSSEGLGYCSASLISEVYFERCFWFPEKRIVEGRVASFSERKDSPTMWSYYANSHKGVCFRYDFDILDMSNQENINIVNSIQKVWYSNVRHVDKDGMFSPFFKAQEWSHEQEWRLFRKFGDAKLYLPCMTEVYLGMEADSDSIDRIIQALKKVNREIKLFLMRPSRESFNLRSLRISY